MSGAEVILTNTGKYVIYIGAFEGNRNYKDLKVEIDWGNSRKDFILYSREITVKEDKVLVDETIASAGVEVKSPAPRSRHGVAKKRGRLTWRRST